LTGGEGLRRGWTVEEHTMRGPRSPAATPARTSGGPPPVRRITAGPPGAARPGRPAPPCTNGRPAGTARGSAVRPAVPAPHRGASPPERNGPCAGCAPSAERARVATALEHARLHRIPARAGPPGASGPAHRPGDPPP